MLKENKLILVFGTILDAVHPKKYYYILSFAYLVSLIVTHILKDDFIGTGTMVWLPQCQLSNPKGYGYIDHMIHWELW